MDSRRFQCSKCKWNYGRGSELNRHIREKHTNNAANFPCPQCDRIFVRNFHRKEHIYNIHKRHASPANDEEPPKKKSRNIQFKKEIDHLPPSDDIFPLSTEVLTSQGYIPDAIPIIREQWTYVRTKYRSTKVTNTYQVRLRNGNIDIAELEEILNGVHSNEKNAYKLQIGFSVLLYKEETNAFRVFYPENPKARFFPQPVIISTQTDIDNCISRLQEDDIRAHLLQNREDTKWKLVSTLTVLITTATLGLEHPFLGSVDKQELPIHAYIYNHRWIKCMDKNTKGIQYKDKLCCFRVIAWNIQKKKGNETESLQTLAKQLAEKYRQAVQLPTSWDGSVTLDQMFQIEQALSCKIIVYQLVPKENTRILTKDTSLQDLQAQQVYCSKFSKTNAKNGIIYMGLCNDHLSAITSINQYSKTYICSHCEKVTNNEKSMKRHESICATKDKGSRARYKGGNFKTSKSIFTKLEQHGFDILPEDKYKKYFVCWDIETMQPKVNSTDSCQPKNGQLKFRTVNRFLSAAVCSNIPMHNYDKAKFFGLLTTAEELTDRMMQYFYEISEVHATLQKKRLAHIFNQIIRKEQDLQTKIDSCHQIDRLNYYKFETKKLKDLESQLIRHTEKLTLYTFNGARFDNKVCRTYLIKTIQRYDKEAKISTIKRHGSYAIISTEKLDFRDFCHMLPPGTSLDNFLKSQEVEVQKSYFPYEWIDCIEKLEKINLPSKEAFYSHLKGKGISDEQYNQCQQIFNQKCTTMWDFLKDYNERDVIGFVAAIEKLISQWRQEADLCIITDAVSLSSLGNKLMHKTTSISHPVLWLPRKEDKAVYDIISESIIGGPSIVFTHRHKVDETFIRKSTKKCQSIIGEDCNSLYLYAIGQDMPTGIPRQWIKDPITKIFKAKSLKPPFVSHDEMEFVLWTQYNSGCTCCQHYLSGDGQASLGPNGKYRPDFMCRKKNLIYLFNGCWIHCCPKCNIKQKDPAKAQIVKTNDERAIQFYTNIGYSVIVVWAHEWEETKRKNPQIKKFLKERLDMPLKWRNTMSELELIQYIDKGVLFGIVKCDIKVPDRLYDDFKDFPPIFCHRLLTRADLSTKQQELAEKLGLMKRPTKALVSVMSQQQMVVTTPLLKWYLDQGIKVKNITVFIQFKPMALFRGFTDKVTQNRSLADREERFKVMGTLWKNAGNSAYGKTLERRENFTTTSFCDLACASSQIRNPRFIDADPLLDPEQIDDPEPLTDRWEITLEKKSYEESIPKQLGAFILGYGKLQMLRFYYEYLDRFFPRDTFEMISMDTDSAYYAISAPSREDFFKLVKPELKAEFEKEKHIFLATKETSRTPGLFKVEWTGSEQIALAAKTYGCMDSDGILQKFSAKGVSRQTNNLNADDYRNVHDGGPLKMVENRGFMFKQSQMFMYTLVKIGLNNFYAKRRQDPQDPEKTLPLIDPPLL